ncbi:MAG TPA: 30S ribosomal protein S3 [Persephonella sp.]|uniref:Small ribosomal subunit protein uS3 n=1 Tax=Persephonella marina (strain DSM 14350 / EX-H1) TaxID=123214 RepID=RS3_PERMH|nr:MULTISPECIES: 30S ribosomal protein S3 [Persephonella]C0QQM9.1 RecName: Full=Small ribosomal subunit protein uS3; AltName: Full=30S ribosomal protein S3 [Persephonella marina EX-H1]ACO04636.1 ribosomal protein S3 [Persephonella marina EX-H1]HCB68726.1 30S ribosomal protein S3 [Persephonella sp.]
MGQKVHPIGFRLGVTKDWKSKWFADKKKYGQLLHEDVKIRKFVEERYKQAGIADVIIERLGEKVRIKILASKPGIVIGRKGAEVEELNKVLQAVTNAKDVTVNVDEVKKPELNAKLVAEDIALQLERRVSHRRAMKRAIDNAMKAGAKGIKVQVGGRIGGVDLARKEWFMAGRMPLQTIRADIDYGTARASTKYGILGVKVWIYKGDKLAEQKEEVLKKIEEELHTV